LEGTELGRFPLLFGRNLNSFQPYNLGRGLHFKRGVPPYYFNYLGGKPLERIRKLIIGLLVNQGWNLEPQGRKVKPQINFWKELEDWEERDFLTRETLAKTFLGEEGEAPKRLGGGGNFSFFLHILGGPPTFLGLKGYTLFNWGKPFFFLPPSSPV